MVIYDKLYKKINIIQSSIQQRKRRSQERELIRSLIIFNDDINKIMGLTKVSFQL